MLTTPPPPPPPLPSVVASILSGLIEGEIGGVCTTGVGGGGGRWHGASILLCGKMVEVVVVVVWRVVLWILLLRFPPFHVGREAAAHTSEGGVGDTKGVAEGKASIAWHGEESVEGGETERSEVGEKAVEDGQAATDSGAMEELDGGMR